MGREALGVMTHPDGLAATSVDTRVGHAGAVDEIAKKCSRDEERLAFMAHPDGLTAASVRDFTFLAEAELPELIEKVTELRNPLQQTSR